MQPLTLVKYYEKNTNNQFLQVYIYVIFHVISFNAFWKVSEIRHGFFSGVNFLSRDFLGFCWKPQRFFWVLIFAPIRSSLSLEMQSTPWIMTSLFDLVLSSLNHIIYINSPEKETPDQCQAFWHCL